MTDISRQLQNNIYRYYNITNQNVMTSKNSNKPVTRNCPRFQNYSSPDNCQKITSALSSEQQDNTNKSFVQLGLTNMVATVWYYWFLKFCSNGRNRVRHSSWQRTNLQTQEPIPAFYLEILRQILHLLSKFLPLLNSWNNYPIMTFDISLVKKTV